MKNSPPSNSHTAKWHTGLRRMVDLKLCSLDLVEAKKGKIIDRQQNYHMLNLISYNNIFVDKPIPRAYIDEISEIIHRTIDVLPVVSLCVKRSANCLPLQQICSMNESDCYRDLTNSMGENDQ